MFDNQIRRNAREGYKAGDKFLFLFILSGLLFFDSIRNKPSRQSSYSSNKSLKQIEEEIAEFKKRWAKPFKCTQTIVMYSTLLLVAYAMPFLGVYLYLQADWWMFFCVLLSGSIGLLCLIPMASLEDSIKSGWKYETEKEYQTTMQIKIILKISIIGVCIAGVLNCYPFVLPHYKESTLVILLVIFILIVHIACLCELINALKNAELSIKTNLARFQE